MTVEAIANMRLDKIRLKKIIQRLNEELGPGLVSRAASDKGYFMSIEWCSYGAGHAEPTATEEVKILALATTWEALSRFGSSNALDWLQNSNSLLDSESPIEVLSKGHFEDFDNAFEAQLNEIRDVRLKRGFAA